MEFVTDIEIKTDCFGEKAIVFDAEVPVAQFCVRPPPDRLIVETSYVIFVVRESVTSRKNKK